MPVLHFADPQSKVDTISVITTLSGAVRAYLHAPETTSPEEYQRIMRALNTERMIAIPAEYNGKPCLEIRDFYKESKLLDLLRKEEIVCGNATRDLLPEDTMTTKERFQNRTLETAGGLYVLGDVCLGVYGAVNAIKNKEYEDLGAAIGYAAGTQALLQYGKEQTPTHLHKLSRDMMEHMYKHGVDVPANSTISGVARDNDTSLPHKIDRFMREFPSEVMNLSFSFAGIMMILATRHQTGIYKNPLNRVQDRILGATTFTSGMLGAFVKEKQPEIPAPKSDNINDIVEWVHSNPLQEKPESLAHELVEWVKERPLRIAGYGLMVSTFIHGISTFRGIHDAHLSAKQTFNYKEMLSHQNEAVSTAFRGMFVVTNLIAEFLISLSSKGHGGGSKKSLDYLESAYSIGADLLLRLPPDQRPGAEEHLATFMAHPDALNIPKPEVIQHLRQRMHTLQQNPWALNAPPQLGHTTDPITQQQAATSRTPTSPTNFAARLAPTTGSHAEKILSEKARPVENGLGG